MSSHGLVDGSALKATRMECVSRPHLVMPGEHVLLIVGDYQFICQWTTFQTDCINLGRSSPKIDTRLRRSFESTTGGTPQTKGGFKAFT